MKKNKYLLISAITINNLGDIIFDMFIAWKLSSVTGSVMNAVYIIGTSVTFRAVLSFFLGSFVDKHSKKKMMIVSHILSIVVIMSFGMFWGLAKQFIAIGIIFVLLNDVNNELFTRSYILMTSNMFDENNYIKFQSYSNIGTRIINVGGTAVAGILIDNISDQIIFAIDIVTYMISLLCIAQVNYIEHKRKNVKSLGIIKTIISDVKYTVKTIAHSSYLLSFILLMFILNLAYGYIPQILPVFKANMTNSAVYLGAMKAAITIGEILGLFFVSKISKYVSLSFKASMILNVFTLIAINLTHNSLYLVFLFTMYGFSDSLTQPLFGYTVSNLETENRGKLLGGIDAIIMFSPSIGIYAISGISNYSEILGAVVLSIIFVIGYLIVSFNRNMKDIVLSSEKIVQGRNADGLYH